MSNEITIVIGTVFYMVVLAFVSYSARRNANSAQKFSSGGTTYPALLIGFLLMSEFIGTAASVGTAEAAYRVGVSAAWNVAALGIGFVLYSWLLASRFKAIGENTISGALARTYGRNVKLATSIIMIFALQIVAISTYTSGGAIVAPLFGIGRSTAICITAAAGVLYVSLGGMSSVIYTNVIHAIVKYIGVIIALVFAIHQIGGVGELQAQLPPEMLAVDTVGWAQICAWLVAGIGAVFATQYVVQAINAVPDEATAKRASFYSALLLIPFGILAAMIGMVCQILYPDIKATQSFPSLIADMQALPATVVVAGLAASLFGTISALSIGAATLVYKDFYLPISGRSGDDPASLRFIRWATIVAGLLPIPLAILSTEVLSVTFLAKSLRASLAVLVLLAFFAPSFGSPRAAMASIGLSLVGVVGWFLAGNPGGIDNAYVAVAIPILVMTVSRLMGGSSAPAIEPQSR
jgi:SSS family solute:Na+ symporter